MTALGPVSGGLTLNTWLVAILALAHIQIATFLTGSSTLVAVGEGIAIATGDERHERLANGLVRTWAYVFSFGSALAIFWVLYVLAGLWGRFFFALQQITFWVFVFEAVTFVAEVILLYTLYANWDRLRAHRRARLALVVLLNISQWWQMFFIDVVASYMLTPNGGDTSYLRQILNPTDLPLMLHRTIGNVAWAGALVALAAGFRYLRVTRRREAVSLDPGRRASARAVGAMAEGALVRERDHEAAYWDWVGQWGLLWAFGMTLIQPWLGYSYAKEVQLHAYDSWYTMMLGWLSNVFVAQLALLGLILILGSWYMWRRLRVEGHVRIARRHAVVFALLVFVVLFSAQPAWFATTYADVVAAHLDRPWWDGGLLNPLGYFVPWKVLGLFLMILLGLYAITSFLRMRIRSPFTLGIAGRGSQGLLIAVGLTVSVMMMVMGLIREGSRGGFLINQQMTVGQQEILSSPPAAPTYPSPPP